MSGWGWFGVAVIVAYMVHDRRGLVVCRDA